MCRTCLQETEDEMNEIFANPQCSDSEILNINQILHHITAVQVSDCLSIRHCTLDAN